MSAILLQLRLQISDAAFYRCHDCGIPFVFLRPHEPSLAPRGPWAALKAFGLLW